MTSTLLHDYFCHMGEISIILMLLSVLTVGVTIGAAFIMWLDWLSASTRVSKYEVKIQQKAYNDYYMAAKKENEKINKSENDRR